jgi:hypothetical protein
VTDSTDRRQSAPLAVATDLTATVNGVDATVESTGNRLFVGFPTISDGLRALRGHPDWTTGPLDSVLKTAGLTLEIRVRDRTVIVAGAAARPGVISRTLGVDPLEVRLGSAVGAVVLGISAAVATVTRLLR